MSVQASVQGSVMEFRGVRRVYDRGKEALRRLDLSVERGEVVALLGRNGAGKTTALRIAMGMLEPHAGAVRLFGLDPFKKPVEVRRRVGYVAEDQVLPAFLRVSEILALHRSLFPTWDHTLERQLIDRFQIDIKGRIGALSKGQARQVALLCAIAHRPELLILDEPAGGLDPAMRREFLETSIALLNQDGSTILFSSHHMSDVERIAARIAFLSGGEIVLDRPLDEVRENYSLVMLTPTDQFGELQLRSLQGCIRTRLNANTIHAVFASPPEPVDRQLAALPINDYRCARISLEDLFIELVEGRS
jgi:ABC-2 type transport system ATP-binding protein